MLKADPSRYTERVSGLCGMSGLSMVEGISVKWRHQCYCAPQISVLRCDCDLFVHNDVVRGDLETMMEWSRGQECMRFRGPLIGSFTPSSTQISPELAHPQSRCSAREKHLANRTGSVVLTFLGEAKLEHCSWRKVTATGENEHTAKA